jgi:hypothetical protein
MQLRPAPGGERRGLLRFDLSDIPLDARIASARLYLYEMNAKGNLVIKVFRVTDNWSESTVTWASPWAVPGGDFDSSLAYALFIPDQQNCSISLDLSSLVQGWVDGSYPNQGVMLIAYGPSTFIEYATKEETTHPEWAPRLEISLAGDIQGHTSGKAFWLSFWSRLLQLFY